MNDSWVIVAFDDARDLCCRVRFWAGLAGVALMLGLIGPFGTYEALRLPARMAYWFAICGLGFWVGYITSVVVATGAENLGVAPPAAVALGALVASVHISLVVATLDALVFGARVLTHALDLLPIVAIICVIVAFLFEALDARDITMRPGFEPAAGPDWLDQLPPSLGRDLISLHAQDHYVAARTPMGETLLRASLGQAASDLGGYGLRVHRSWWVARHWVAGSETRKGQLFLVLQDGARVPVGRVYRAAVRTRLQNAEHP